MHPNFVKIVLIYGMNLSAQKNVKILRFSDFQIFREVTLALPREQSHEKNKNCVEDYCTRNFTDQGMVAHLSYHASKNGNPHVHIMLTMRELNKKGFGQKNRSWNM